MVEISEPNVRKLFQQHDDWQEKYTGLPINFIEEIENAKIKELQNIVVILEDLNEKSSAALELQESINASHLEQVKNNNRVLIFAFFIIGSLCAANFI